MMSIAPSKCSSPSPTAPEAATAFFSTGST
jgi:hypothetical protein